MLVEILPGTSLGEETALLDGSAGDADDGPALPAVRARANREVREVGRRGLRFVFDHT